MATPRPTPRPIEIDDLLRLRIPGDPQIAPDGSQVLFTVREGSEKPGQYRNRLFLVDADGGEPRAFTAGPRDSKGRWSPDGRTIAFLRNEPKARPQIHVIGVDGGEARPLTSFPEGTIASFKWSPRSTSGRGAARGSKGESGSPSTTASSGDRIAVMFRALDPALTEEAQRRRATAGESDPPRSLDDIWYRLDGDGYFGAARFALHVIDVESGRTRVLFDRDRMGSFSYDWSPDGSTIAVTSNTSRRPLYEPWHDEILLVDVATGRSKVLAGVPEGPKAGVVWSPDGRSIAWAGRNDRLDGIYSTENLRCWVADVQGDRAKKVRCLTEQSDECLMAAILSDSSDATFDATLLWSPDSSRISMKIGRRGQGHLASVVRDGGDLRFHTHGEGDRSFGNFDRTGEHLAMTLTSFTAPPEVAIVTDAAAGADQPRGKRGADAATAKVRRLTRLNDAFLREVVVSVPESHLVKAADGHESQLWVMRPAAGTKKGRSSRTSGARKGGRTAAILLVHGGPHAMYGESFFHEMQMLCARGWTICFGNPRGSKGYGRDHCAAIRGAWGEKDWADIEGYAAFMQADAAIDPARLAIAGGSYGGYMTIWAIGHTTAFNCAIADRCVSNLLSMAGNSDYQDVTDEYWPGAVWERWERRWESSPIRHIGAARTPTLIIHSEGDLRCNVEQSEQVFSALSSLGVPTRFVRYPASTSHGMSRTGPPDLRRHRLGAMVAWFETYLSQP